MGDILIRGMEMPEHCGYCRFRYDGICHVLQKTQYSMEECPLIPVPPHGRLVDIDTVIDVIQKFAHGREEAGAPPCKVHIIDIPILIQAVKEIKPI